MTNNYLMEIARIIENGLAGERTKVEAYAKQLAVKLEQKDPSAAQRIHGILKKMATSIHASSMIGPVPVDSESRFALADVEKPQQGDVDVVLAGYIQKKVDEFIRFAQASEVLFDAKVGISATLLLYGPPGVGKTILARYVAAQLGLPLLIARSDALISSFLGNTAKNLRALFEHARRRPCVLFLDEIDSIAKMRDDQHELGELKRVVISLLQNIDSLDGRTVLLAATNHAHLLDSALWRRFAYQIELKQPEREQRCHLLSLFLGHYALSSAEELEVLTSLSEGLSGAELRGICENAIRRAVLDHSAHVRYRDMLSLVLELKSKCLFNFDSSDKETIRTVWNSLNGAVKMKDIAELFNVSVSSISRAVKPGRHNHGG